MMRRLVDRTPWVVLWAFLVALVAAGVWAFMVSQEDNTEQTSRINTQESTIAQQGDDLDALAQAVAEANRRLVSVGVPQVPVPVTDAPTVTAPPVLIQKPSPADLDAAVRRYCAGGTCRAPGVTPTQVRAALAAYCARGVCVGPTGDRGTDGTPGDPGSNGSNGTDGAPGPGPTDAQVAAAVASYCGNPAGTCQGRGITSLGCSVTAPPGLTLLVTYTDGTSESVTCTGSATAP